MAEWLGNGLQNHVQQFDSAWHLITTISGCSETGAPADLFIGINECRLKSHQRKSEITANLQQLPILITQYRHS